LAQEPDRLEGDPGSTFYISSVERDDMVKAIMEFIARQEH
jgi:hypothetical protein